MRIKVYGKIANWGSGGQSPPEAEDHLLTENGILNYFSLCILGEQQHDLVHSGVDYHVFMAGGVQN
jgi:hypothetical protein